MTELRSLGARKDATRGTTAIEVRKTWEGMLVRLGVFQGGTDPLVVGTAGWAYSVGITPLVSQRAAGDGDHVWGNDGLVSVACSAAPGTPGESRVDIIYALAKSNTENADTDSVHAILVIEGADGAPGLPPTVPPGGLELARNTMTSAAVDTAGAGNTITQTVPYTTMRGGYIHCRTTVERDALTVLATAANPLLTEVGGVFYSCADATNWLLVGGDDTDWWNLTLEAGTSTVDGLTPRLRRLNGVVYASGRVLQTLTLIAGVPVGWRPARSCRMVVTTGNSGVVAGVLVYDSGTGFLNTAGGATINLDGLSWIADA